MTTSNSKPPSTDGPLKRALEQNRRAAAEPNPLRTRTEQPQNRKGQTTTTNAPQEKP